MRRREFISLIGGVAAAWPLSARGQQPAKAPIIGFLGASTASAGNQWAAAFVQRLRELGWTEDQTIAIEYRWTDGQNERVPALAAEFVQLKVRVIVTYGNTVAAAIKPTVTPIPVVFAAAGDPVGTGLVASLARPGGNVTGLSIQQTDLAGNVSKSCASCFPISTRWRSSPTLAVPMRCWKWARLMPRRAVLALPSFGPKFAKPRISRLRLMHLKAAWKPSMFVAIR